MRPARDELPGVRAIVDTRRGEDVRGIGHAEGDVLVTYHVTDRPEAIVRLLRRRPNLLASYERKRSELGPGFYVSGVPEFWVGRATRKWSFLRELKPGQVFALTGALTKEVEGDRRLTDNELARALRDIRLVETGVYDPDVLTFLAGPPYTIAFWRPEFLKPIGITPSRPPGVIRVHVRGRFAELSSSYPPAPLLRTLRRAGYQGAFTRSGISTNPELVIWDPRAIVSAEIEPDVARDVTPYKLRRRVYWAKLKELLEERYGRRPTSEGHRIADLAFRRKIPLRTLARRLALDPKLSRPLRIL